MIFLPPPRQKHRTSFRAEWHGCSPKAPPSSYAAQLCRHCPQQPTSRDAHALSRVHQLKKITRRARYTTSGSRKEAKSAGARYHHSFAATLSLYWRPPPFPCTIRGESATDRSRCKHIDLRGLPQHASNSMPSDSEMRSIAVRSSCQRLKIYGGNIAIPRIQSKGLLRIGGIIVLPP
jgi:hypothetical protein